MNGPTLQRVLLPIGLFVALAQLGCAGARVEAVEKQVLTMQRQLETTTEAYQAQNQRIESLRDQLALLQDQLEAYKVAAARPRPELPVVRLTPDDLRPEPMPDPASVPTITQADVGVSPRRRGPRRPVEPPANAVHAGNIGVLPLAGGAAAASPERAEQPQRYLQPPPPPPVFEDPNDPVTVYKRAYGLYKKGQAAEAIKAFTRFVDDHPQHGYADNALFWMGVTRYERIETAAALKIFRRVIAEYPSGNKVPDSLFMIGLTLDKLGRPAESREMLQRLMRMYPDTDAARRAARELDAPAGGRW